MTFDQLLQRWQASGEAERANKDSFLNELCDALGVERPRPKVNDPAVDGYAFEKDVARTKAGGMSPCRDRPMRSGLFGSARATRTCLPEGSCAPSRASEFDELGVELARAPTLKAELEP